MSVSDVLEIPQMTETQSQKAATHNEAMLAIEKAITGYMEVATVDAASNDDVVVLPFEDDDTLSERQALRMVYLRLNAGATADFEVWHPDNPHLFYVTNDTTQTASIYAVDEDDNKLGQSADVPPLSSNLVYTDGDDFELLLAAFTQAVTASDVHFNYFGNPAADEVIGQILVARETTITADFLGAQGNVSSSPDSTYTMLVKDDGTTIGTVEVNTGGNFSFATTSNTGKVVAAGSLLTLVAPATADASIDGISVAIPATVVVSQ